MPLNRIRGFAFDLDGTIWAGSHLFPGARELVHALRKLGHRVIFASNSSRHGASHLARRLREFGIAAEPSDVVAAFDLIGEEVGRRLGPSRVLVLGTDELAELMMRSGHEVVPLHEPRGVDVVVVGNDPQFDFERLRVASRAVAAGAAFYAVNLDAQFPVGEHLFDPGCGALAEAVAVASGVRPVVVGKPYEPFFEVALRRLGCLPREAAMIGDNLATDIVGGRNFGMFTVWINPAGHADPPPEADLVVTSIMELNQLWGSILPASEAPT